MNAMFDQAYLDKAMYMTKRGNRFFWEPRDRWYFAFQRGVKVESHTKETLFSVAPIFHETRIEIWPVGLRVKSMTFRQPWPSILMLYHDGVCVWNMGLKRPSNPDEAMKIGMDSFVNQSIIVIQDIDPELCESLRRKWVEFARVRV